MESARHSEHQSWQQFPTPDGQLRSASAGLSVQDVFFFPCVTFFIYSHHGDPWTSSPERAREGGVSFRSPRRSGLFGH